MTTTIAAPDTLTFPIDLRPWEFRAFLASPPRKSTITRLVAPGNSTVNGYSPRNYRWADLWFDHATARTQSLLAVAIAGPVDAPTDVRLSVPYAGLDYTRADPVELLPSYRVRPKWEAGDTLWGRETWTLAIPAGASIHADRVPHYKADDLRVPRWQSPVLMPRWASRLTLTIRAVHVHRLRDVTQEQAIAAGVYEVHGNFWAWDTGPGYGTREGWREAYRAMCEVTHGKGSYEADCWAWTAVVDVAVKN